MKPLGLLLSDPPWLFGDKLPGKSRGAERHYRCMTVAELCTFKLPPLADDALLLLWRMSSMPDAALQVARAWGFEPHSELVWVKTTGPFLVPERAGELPEALLAFGMGRIVRGAHETVLICKRGRPEIRDRSVRSVFFSRRRTHSEKPPAIYRIAERLSAGPYGELFARQRRAGWWQHGDELPALERAQTKQARG